MIDSQSEVTAEEVRQIREQHVALRRQSQNVEFDPTPYETATALLESLPATEFVDARVGLAWEICLATGTRVRPDLSRRALYAAFPDGSRVKDKHLERRWFAAASSTESASGNVGLALKYKVVALKLSEELKYPAGFYNELGNLAYMAVGAGLYQDAIEYATAVLNAKGFAAGEPLTEGYAAASLNRACAFLRLGRLPEAARDIAGCLASIPLSG